MQPLGKLELCHLAREKPPLPIFLNTFLKFIHNPYILVNSSI